MLFLFILIQKIKDLKNHPSKYLSDLSKILKIDKDGVRISIADTYNKNLHMIQYLRKLNPKVKITLSGYYNPIAFLGIIQKLTGLQTIFDEFNKTIAAVTTTLNNTTKQMNVNFVSYDRDFNNFGDPVKAFGTRAKVFTNYNNTFRFYKSAIPTKAQIESAQIFGGGTFFPHVSDIHPSAIGQVAIARRLYVFGFKPFLNPAMLVNVKNNIHDIQKEIDLPDFSLNERSWIIKRKYTNASYNPLTILDDVSFPENNKYFPDSLRLNYLGDRDYTFDGETINERYKNIFNDLAFDNGALGILNEFAKVVVENMGKGLVDGFSTGLGFFASALNKDFQKLINGQQNAYTKGDDNVLLKVLFPAIKELAKGNGVDGEATNLTKLFEIVLKGDPTSWGYDILDEKQSSTSSLPIIQDRKGMWLYVDEIVGEWFKNIFNNYFFDLDLKVLHIGMIKNLNLNDGHSHPKWSKMIKDSQLGQVEWNMLQVILSESTKDSHFFNKFAKNYWDLMKRNSLLENILRKAVQGMLKEEAQLLSLFGIIGEIDLRNKVLVNIVVPSIIFNPMKEILTYAKNFPTEIFSNPPTITEITNMIQKIDQFSNAFVDSYTKIYDNYGSLVT